MELHPELNRLFAHYLDLLTQVGQGLNANEALAAVAATTVIDGDGTTWRVNEHSTPEQPLFERAAPGGEFVTCDPHWFVPAQLPARPDAPYGGAVDTLFDTGALPDMPTPQHLPKPGRERHLGDASRFGKLQSLPALLGDRGRDAATLLQERGRVVAVVAAALVLILSAFVASRPDSHTIQAAAITCPDMPVAVDGLSDPAREVFGCLSAPSPGPDVGGLFVTVTLPGEPVTFAPEGPVDHQTLAAAATKIHFAAIGSPESLPEVPASEGVRADLVDLVRVASALGYLPDGNVAAPTTGSELIAVAGQVLVNTGRFDGQAAATILADTGVTGTNVAVTADTSPVTANDVIAVLGRTMWEIDHPGAFATPDAGLPSGDVDAAPENTFAPPPTTAAPAATAPTPDAVAAVTAALNSGDPATTAAVTADPGNADNVARAAGIAALAASGFQFTAVGDPAADTDGNVTQTVTRTGPDGSATDAPVTWILAGDNWRLAVLPALV